MSWSMMASLRAHLADPLTRNRAVVAILAIGAVLRLTYLFLGQNLLPMQSEMQRVAVTFANTGAFADPYFVGSGPTAHVSPIGVFIGAAAYRLLGTETPAAEINLAVYSIVLTLISYLLLYRVFRQLGTDAATALAALAFLALTLLHPKLEVVAFRILEGSLTVALIAGVLMCLQPIDAGRPARTRDLFTIALLLGLLMLVSPSAAIGGYAATLYVVARKLSAARLLRAGTIVLAGFALFVGPWAYRNYAVFGQPIVTRSNFGLELAISYNSLAASDAPRRETYLATLQSIHPLNSGEAQVAVRRNGELSYLQGVGDTAKAWISEHPGQAVSILLRHAVTFVVPSPWMYDAYARPSTFNRLKALMLGVLGVLALVEVVRLLLQRRLEYLPLLITFSLAAAPYVLVQPVIRYRYLVYGLSVFLAFSLIFSIGHGIAERMIRGRAPSNGKADVERA